MLTVENLRFSYQNCRPILTDISFSLPRGEVLCLLGPNGTGKTTLLRCLLGLNHRKGGQILWQEQNIDKFSSRQRARVMAYVPQSSALTFPYEVCEIVMMGRVPHLSYGSSPSQKDRQFAMEMLRLLGIEDMANKLFQRLSGGEKQLVLIARALAQQADLLVLDEPTASLDFSNQARTLKLIRRLAERGYTVLMTTHSPDQAFLAATKVLMLQNGLVFASGSPNAVITSENLSSLYNTPAIIAESTIVGGITVKVCVPVID